MEQSISQLIARATGAAFTATSRPAMTFFFCQLAVFISLRQGWIQVVQNMQWLVSMPMLGAGLAATIAELLVEHSEQLEEIVRNLHIDKLSRVLGSLLVGLLMISIGVDSAAYNPIPSPVSSPEQLGAIATTLSDSSQPLWVNVSVVAGSVALTQTLAWLRAAILGWLDDLHLKKLWQVVETGGVIGFLILLALSPLLTVALAAVVTAIMILVAVVVRAIDKAVDKSRRRPCPNCGENTRCEALLCWKCKHDLEPAHWLAPESSLGLMARMKEHFATWKAQRQSAA